MNPCAHHARDLHRAILAQLEVDVTLCLEVRSGLCRAGRTCYSDGAAAVAHADTAAYKLPDSLHSISQRIPLRRVLHIPSWTLPVIWPCARKCQVEKLEDKSSVKILADPPH